MGKKQETGLVASFDELARVAGGICQKNDSTLSESEIAKLALCVNEAKQVEKHVKEVVKEAKDRIHSHLVATGWDGEETAVIEAPEADLKLELQVVRSGGGIDADALFNALYEHFDEPLGSKDGQAWKVWTSITDPVQTRVLNEGKLEGAIERAIEKKQGAKHGNTKHYLPLEAVSKATHEPTRSYRFVVKPLKKR